MGPGLPAVTQRLGSLVQKPYKAKEYLGGWPRIIIGSINGVGMVWV